MALGRQWLIQTRKKASPPESCAMQGKRTVFSPYNNGEQAVSLELVSGTLTTNIGIQVTVTGGTATLNSMYHWCVGRGSYQVL